MQIYTIGHSTHSLSTFMGLVREAGIECIADVRSFPRSRRHPQFNIGTLAVTLGDARVRYKHFPDLGGRRGAQDLGEPSPNQAWQEPGFRNYADYALLPAFRQALSDLRDVAAEQSVAIMCAEAVWWRCHRRIIADHLIAMDDEVIHILPTGRTQQAVMSENAMVQPDGRVTYPPPQPRLL
ncbi:MAG: DUF488 domain-containing protein [Hyphomicrobiales bacterium]|nr:DUF488 domain-containing protein [Hyphomicrobiales bacterium]